MGASIPIPFTNIVVIDISSYNYDYNLCFPENRNKNYNTIQNK